MRNLLAFAAAAALAFAGLGYYFDWYKIQSTPTVNGRQSISIDLDRRKISDDLSQGVRKGEEKLQDVLEAKGK